MTPPEKVMADDLTSGNDNDDDDGASPIEGNAVCVRLLTYHELRVNP